MRTPLAWSAAVDIRAASDGNGKLPTFEMLAYAGGPLKLASHNAPVIVDLSTLTVTDALPALKDHKLDQVVGHVVDVQNDGKTITASGIISGASDAAAEVVAASKNGFQWQCSIGADPGTLDFVSRGETITANGSTFDGPLYLSRNTVLREISFTSVGCDPSTQVAIAATRKTGVSVMTFAEWLNELNIDPAKLTVEQTASLQKAFDAMLATTSTTTNGGSVSATWQADSPEAARIVAVRKIAADHPEIQATAIAAGWNERETGLAVVRASRAGVPGLAIAHEADSGKAIEAALCLSCGVPATRLLASYGERCVEAAERKYRGVGLHGIVRETLRAAGRPVGPGRIGQTEIREAFQADRQLRAAFSTSTLSGIVGNVASKILLDAFSNVASVWRSIAKVESNPDFKPSKRYRFTARGKLEEVAPDGRLKHVSLEEAEHESELSTYGAIVQLSRKDLVNDDLGAFSQLPAQFGRLAGIKLEKSLFELLLSNPSSFFSTGNKNFDDGNDTALSIASLSAAEAMFMSQVDANGDPILVRPKTLLVPSSLAGTARVLCNSTQIVTGENATIAANNPHAGNFTPISTPWLENSAITGNSAKAWYLFADPQQLAAIEVAFLNGAESPIIEEGQPDFDQLGLSYRVVYDFGVGMRETAGAIKCKGEA